jgi:hypothetical protein
MWKQRKKERNENKKDSRKKMSHGVGNGHPQLKKKVNLMLFSEKAAF